MTRIGYLCTAALAISASPAVAYDPIPNYQVERWCDQVARAAGARSEVIYGGCIDQEQSAYNALRDGTWGGLAPATRNWCDQVARSGGGGSFVILLSCANQETAASRQNGIRRFER
jgi:hypothetical protein